jgi:SAM-dependent methyltransferase
VIKHPAQYSPKIVDLMVARLAAVRGTVLDPFAGPGQHLPLFEHPPNLPKRKVIGLEIEQPWVDAGAPLVQQADSTAMPLRAKSVSAIITSPVYGNRMSDHHRARDNSERRSYTHDIREQTGDPDYELDPCNAGKMAYGREYQVIHAEVYRECWRVARPGCVFLLNVSDFIRKGERVPSAIWHLATCIAIGWNWHDATRIETPRMRRGQNGAARVDCEWVYELWKAE